MIEGKKLTIDSFADDYGIARSTVHLWLKRSGPPLEKHWSKLAEYFGVSEAFIASGRPNFSDFESGNLEEAMQAPYLAGQARNADFNSYLEFIRAMREEAERLANGDMGKAQQIFDRLLDGWSDHRQSMAAKHEQALKAALLETSRRKKPPPQSSPATTQGGAGR